MKNLKKELDKIIEEIASDFENPLRDDELRQLLFKPSKRIRSRLGILFLKIFEKELTPDLIKVFAATEIIHNASLLHDDVIDSAKFRRGLVTISEKYNQKISILAGDYLLTCAIKKLISIDNKEILEIFRNCTEKMCRAEIEQYYYRNKLPSKEKYLNICKNKTAILFIALLESCAILTGLNREKAVLLAEKFGIIFQINNDLEELSAIQDKDNGIHTAIDILGVENTKILLDNYLEELKILLKDFPENIYKNNLEDLISSYV